MLSSDTTPQLGQLTSLEQLSLICRSLQPELLASLTQLADLRLVGRLDNGSAPDNAALFEVLSGMNHLTRLHLEVDGGWDDGDCKATQVLVEQSDWYSAVTSSSKLQHLHLDMPLPQSAWKEMFHADLQLPELKTLHANGYPGTHEGVLFDSDHMPGLIHLTVLQSLCLRWFIPDPNALLALPQLRNLRLHLKSAYLGDLNIARADVFYQVLPQLQHLTSLQYGLTSDPRPWCNDPPYAFSWPPVDPDVYTWRRMQHLQLGLPKFCGGFWRRLFAQGLLQHLGSPPGGCCSNNLPPSVLGRVTLVDSFHSALKVGYMSREGLTALAAEYPSLRNLYFGVDPSAGVDMSVLSQLRGLTELAISNVGPTAVGDLAVACSRVKGLKVLYLWFHGRCCADQCRADLTPLTSLTQLTRLTAGCYCMAAASNSSLLSLLSSMTASKVPGLLYEATGPTEAAWAPPVWRQLMRHCKGLSVSQCYEDIIDSMNYCSDQLQYFAQLTFGHLWS